MIKKRPNYVLVNGKWITDYGNEYDTIGIQIGTIPPDLFHPANEIMKENIKKEVEQTFVPKLTKMENISCFFKPSRKQGIIDEKVSYKTEEVYNSRMSDINKQSDGIIRKMSGEDIIIKVPATYVLERLDASFPGYEWKIFSKDKEKIKEAKATAANMFYEISHLYQNHIPEECKNNIKEKIGEIFS